MPRILLFAILNIFALASVAAPPAQKSTQEKLYRVDVLVFEHRDSAANQEEHWQAAAGELPGLSDAVEPAAALPPDSPLFAALAELDRDRDYMVLAHKSWTQPAQERSASTAALIRSEDGELEGTVRFYTSRFLHLEANLAFRPEETPGLRLIRPPDPEAASPDAGDPGATEPRAMGVEHRISERRRIRAEETHYLDHPRFGVLVRVIPLK